MPFIFDLPSIFLAGATASLICTVAILALHNLHRESRDAMLWGAATLGMSGLGMFALALCDAAPQHDTLVLGYSFAGAGVFLQYESNRRLCMLPPRGWFAIAGVALVFAIHLVASGEFGSPSARAAFNAIIFVMLSAIAIPMMLRRIAIDPPVPVRIAVAFASAIALVQAMRALMLVTGGLDGGPDRLHEMGPAHGIAVLILASTPIAVTMILIAWVGARLARDLHRLATIDELTQVRSRRSFTELARASLAAPGRNKALGFLMLDLDRFKQVNDRFGHATGDQVLAHVARQLQRVCIGDDLIGRYGGEEFCALLVRDSDDEIRQAGEWICRAVRETPFVSSTRTISCSVSIGIAYHYDGASLDTLLVRADRLVYVAKALGRDRVVDAEPEVEILAEARANPATGPNTLPR